MRRWATIVLCLGIGGAFAWGVPLNKLFDALSLVSNALAIIAAGLLVRLNRTMPSLEWKSIDPDQRQRLTAQIVGLTREYLVILALVAAFIGVVVTLIAIGKDGLFGTPPQPHHAVVQGWPSWLHRTLSGVVGLGISLIVVRMGYVVWRDYDIVRLQKTVIDTAAAKEQLSAQQSAADTKVAAMTSANLKGSGPTTPKAWND